MRRSTRSATSSSRSRSGPFPAVRPSFPFYHLHQQRERLMDTTPPLHTQRTRIIAEQLKMLGKPLRALLTALHAFFAQPPRPPVNTLPPTSAETPPPGMPETRS